MLDAYIYDGARTAIGRYAGALAKVRPDDLLATVIRAVVERGPFAAADIEDVIAGISGTVKEAWQIYVDTVDGTPQSMDVAVECERGYNGDPSDLADTVARSISSRLGLKVPVKCHQEGTLPRYEAKAQRVTLKEQS